MSRVLVITTSLRARSNSDILAQRLIAGGLVKLNHEINLHADARLMEGDMISVRGHGRVRVTQFQGESRRGRQVVQVFRYGK